MWTPQRKDTFFELKKVLTSAPVLSDAIVQHRNVGPGVGITEGNLYCELTIVHCSGFIVSKSQKARWQNGRRGWHCNADALSHGQTRQCGMDYSCTEFEEEEEVMMAAEVSIPTVVHQDIRNLQEADPNLRTAMEWVEPGITPMSTKFNLATQILVDPEG